MREAIRDIDRLRHILEQIDSLQALMPELSFDNLDKDNISLLYMCSASPEAVSAWHRQNDRDHWRGSLQTH